MAADEAVAGARLRVVTMGYLGNADEVDMDRWRGMGH